MAYKTTYDLWNYLQDVLNKQTEYKLGKFGQTSNGKYQYDCVCLIKSFPWCDGVAGQAPVYQKNGIADDWIGAFFEKASIKSKDMGQIPMSGIYLIYMNNDHIAVYNADTKTEIECCAGQTMKVVERPLNYYDADPRYIWNKWSTLYWCPQGAKNTRSTIYKAPEAAPQAKTIYRVQCGAFLIKSNAVRRYNELKSKGFSVYLIRVGLYYKVQVGAYGLKENADRMISKVRAAGYDAFITTQAGTAVSLK